MTRDDFVPSIGSDHGAFVFGGCCGTVSIACVNGKLRVSCWSNAGYSSYVVALGIAFCFWLVHGKLCIGH